MNTLAACAKEQSVSNDSIVHCATQAFFRFKSITRRHGLFHIFFFLIGFLELSTFILCFSMFAQSALLAFSFAGIFFTAFTYFVLLFYLQTKKNQELIEIKQALLEECHNGSVHSKTSAETLMTECSAIDMLLTLLHRAEYCYYPLSESFATLAPLMQKLSAWMHWKDLHQMKELLIFASIQHQIELIKLHPTDLETHAQLAHTYMTLSKLYTDPHKIEPDTHNLWVSKEYESEIMRMRFAEATQRAIEELKIIDTYAPGSPWVNAQLAGLYYSLGNIKEEMDAYEKILEISPDEGEILLRLGIRCFEQGRTARALRLYEQLKSNQDPKAEELIAHYS